MILLSDSSDDSGSALLRSRLAGSGLYLISGPEISQSVLRFSDPALRSHRFHLCEPTVRIPPEDLYMLSISSHPHTTLLPVFWTSLIIPHLTA